MTVSSARTVHSTVSAPSVGPVTARLLDARVRLSRGVEEFDTSGEPPLWCSERVDGATLWVASGYDAARAALTDPRLRKVASIDTGPWVARDRVEVPGRGDSDFVLLRPFATAAVGRRRVAQVAPFLPMVAEGLIDECDRQGGGDLLSDFAFPFAVDAVARLLGVPRELVGEYLTIKRWETDQLSPRYESADVVEASVAAVESRYLWAERLVAYKRRVAGRDPLTQLIAKRDAGEFEEPELLTTIVVIMIQSYVSFVGFLGASLFALWQRPALLANPAGIVNGVDELLRFTSPHAVFFPRFPAEPMTLHGIQVVPGDAVMVHAALANRDPARFAEPNQIDLKRNTAPNLTFGHGVQNCLGAALARLEATVALKALAPKLPGIAPAVPLEDIPWIPGCTGPIDQLHVFAAPTQLPIVFNNP